MKVVFFSLLMLMSSVVNATQPPRDIKTYTKCIGGYMFAIVAVKGVHGKYVSVDMEQIFIRTNRINAEPTPMKCK